MNLAARAAVVSASLSVVAATQVACSSSDSVPAEEPTAAGSEETAAPCNDENPARLAEYDATRECFEPVTAVDGVCLSNLDLEYVGGLANIECAFDSTGHAYARLGIEGEWLTGAGWTFVNLSPTGPWPQEQVASETQAALCERIACAPDCATGAFPYAGQAFAVGSCGRLPDGGAIEPDAQ
jgi:hypothetical protein